MPHKDPEARREYQRKRFALLKAGAPEMKKWAEQRREATRNSYRRNRDERLAKRKEKRLANLELARAKERAAYRRNREAIRKRAALRFAREKDEVQKKRNERYKSDIQFRLAYNLRNRLRQAVKKSYCAGSAVADLGCSIGEFKEYLEGLFAEGMSWSNLGQWHVDHIVPLASLDLTVRENVIRACHYTNLQPLWAAENLRKGGRVAFAENQPYTEVAHQSEQRLTGARTDSAMTDFVMEKTLNVRTLASSPA